MLDINEIISYGTAYIDKARFAMKPNLTDRVNMINRIGRELGIEQMSTDYPDAFAHLMKHLNKKLGIMESKMNDLSFIEEALKTTLSESETPALDAICEQLRTLSRYSEDEMEWDELRFDDSIRYVKSKAGEKLAKIINMMVETLPLRDINPLFLRDLAGKNNGADFFQDLKYWVNFVYERMIGDEINEATVLTEADYSLPQSTNVLRYEDEDVVKILKQLCKKEFRDFKLTRVTGDQGGAFYSIEVEAHTEDVQNDLELKRFVLAKMMADFRAQFFAVVSKVLPVVNIKTTPYQFTKNSNKVKFGLVLALSHTNDREWVTGAYKKVDSKKAENLVDAQSKEDKKAVKESTIKEMGVRIVRKEIVVPDTIDVFDAADKLKAHGIVANVMNHNTLLAKWSVTKFTPEEVERIVNG